MGREGGREGGSINSGAGVIQIITLPTKMQADRQNGRICF
jgi:hypothetical protein